MTVKGTEQPLPIGVRLGQLIEGAYIDLLAHRELLPMLTRLERLQAPDPRHRLMIRGSGIYHRRHIGFQGGA